jgi:hypothetical protein
MASSASASITALTLAATRHLVAPECIALHAHLEAVLGFGCVPSLAEIHSVVIPSENKSLSLKSIEKTRALGAYLVEIGQCLVKGNQPDEPEKPAQAQTQTQTQTQQLASQSAAAQPASKPAASNS